MPTQSCLGAKSKAGKSSTLKACRALLRELYSPASERRAPGTKWLCHPDAEASDPPSSLLLSLFAEILYVLDRILRACSRWMAFLLGGHEEVPPSSTALAD